MSLHHSAQPDEMMSEVMLRNEDENNCSLNQ